jgi:hypothetical protein
MNWVPSRLLERARALRCHQTRLENIPSIDDFPMKTHRKWVISPTELLTLVIEALKMVL